jgi:hypothetical protein
MAGQPQPPSSASPCRRATPTSDYWRIWFYLLEAAGLDVQLVRARDVKQAPGRPKTDPLTELPGEVPQVSGTDGNLGGYGRGP